MRDYINDGKAAFPVPGTFDPQSGVATQYPETGMTLRDYFAGQAAGECFAQALKQGSPTDIDAYTSRAAYWAYALADAMLAERSK